MAETELIISQHFQVHNLLMACIIKSTEETIILIKVKRFAVSFIHKCVHGKYELSKQYLERFLAGKDLHLCNSLYSLVK